MLSDMIRGWDRATWIRTIKWAVKWVIVTAMVIYVLVDLHAKERAAEARLQRIEASLAHIEAQQDTTLYNVERARINLAWMHMENMAFYFEDVGTYERARAARRDSLARTARVTPKPDTLLSLGPITVVRRP